jgi:hypothetical protein
MAFVSPFIEQPFKEDTETQNKRNGANLMSGNLRDQAKNENSLAHNYVLSNDMFIQFKFFELIHQKYMVNYIKNAVPTAGEEQKKYDDALIKKINALTSN